MVERMNIYPHRIRDRKVGPVSRSEWGAMIAWALLLAVVAIILFDAWWWRGVPR